VTPLGSGTSNHDSQDARSFDKLRKAPLVVGEAATG
jgi:hypothetical protein